jgi:hypothetical protein
MSHWFAPEKLRHLLESLRRLQPTGGLSSWIYRPNETLLINRPVKLFNLG